MTTKEIHEAQFLGAPEQATSNKQAGKAGKSKVVAGLGNVDQQRHRNSGAGAQSPDTLMAGNRNDCWPAGPHEYLTKVDVAVDGAGEAGRVSCQLWHMDTRRCWWGPFGSLGRGPDDLAT